jgi:hypothetical protein
MGNRGSHLAAILASLAAQACTAFVDACERITEPDRHKTYRLEAYYMRGPGPKWREKHGSIHIPRFEP